MKTHALILLSIVIISCTNNKTNYNNVLLTEKTLPEVKELELEKIDLPEDYSIGSICYVYKDTILLVLKRDNPYPLTHMLTLFNMKTWNKIGEYFTRGQGPHDFLSLTGFIGGNRLDLCCHNSAKIVSFNIDSALTYGYEYTPHIITHKDEGLLDFRYFGNGSFLISNMFYFDGCQKYKTDASVPEFYIINSKGENSPPLKV